MVNTPSGQADDIGMPDDADAEHSQYGGGETGGGKPADGIAGNLRVKREASEEGDAADVAVPPEEDPKMGV